MNRKEIIEKLASSDPPSYTLEGREYHPSPCISSGFCCTQAPCGYGEWNENKSACKFLTAPNDLGQRKCEKYDWIKENVANYHIYPAFGSGCGSTMFNHLREDVIEAYKKKHGIK